MSPSGICASFYSCHCYNSSYILNNDPYGIIESILFWSPLLTKVDFLKFLTLFGDFLPVKWLLYALCLLILPLAVLLNLFADPLWVFIFTFDIIYPLL